MMTINGIAASLGEEADNDEGTAHRFEHTYKRTREIGIGDADIGETPSPKNLRKDQFLNSLREKRPLGRREGG